MLPPGLQVWVKHLNRVDFGGRPMYQQAPVGVLHPVIYQPVGR